MSWQRASPPCTKSLACKRSLFPRSHLGKVFGRAASPSTAALTDASGPLARFKLFFSRPRTLMREPLTAFGMLVLKTAEYAAAGVGYTLSRLQTLRPTRQEDT